MSEVNPNVSNTPNPALTAGNTVESMAPKSVNLSANTGLPSADDLDRVAEELQLIAEAQKSLTGTNQTATEGFTSTGHLAADVRAMRAELDDLHARIAHFNARSSQKI
jgi:hypothetical protein